VDAVVGGKIFNNLKQYISVGNRGILIVLNQYHLLHQCDRIVFLEYGQSTVGTFEELNKLSSFQKFMSSYQSKGTEKSIDEMEVKVAAAAIAPGGVTDIDAMSQDEETKTKEKELKSKVEDKKKTDEPAQLISKDTSVKGVVQFKVPLELFCDLLVKCDLFFFKDFFLLNLVILIKLFKITKTQVLFQYIRSAGWYNFCSAMFVMLCSFVMLGCNDLWLAHWTSKVDRGEVNGGNWYYCGIYCAFSGMYIVLNLGSSYEFVRLSAVASKLIHGGCLTTVLGAPLSWFESVPSGRILSRFSSDMGIMDVQFTFYSEGLIQLSLSGVLLLAILAATDIKLLGLCFICAAALVKASTTIFMSLREFKRMSNMAISPLVTNVGEAVRGRLIGRVLNVKDFFVSRHLELANHYLTASYTSSTLIQFNGVLVQFIGLWVSVTVSLYVLLDPNTDKSTAGLMLTYSFLLPYFLNLASDMSMLFFSLMPGMDV
jgi:hypothetical protein